MSTIVSPKLNNDMKKGWEGYEFNLTCNFYFLYILRTTLAVFKKKEKKKENDWAICCLYVLS